jgi:DnaJ family protein C protein 25
LKDDVKREQYDYAVAHPDQFFYNTARYYQAYYGPQADLRAVLVGLLLVLSGFQYLNEHLRYRQIVAMVKKTPAYKNKMKALELEHSQAGTNKKKGSKNKIRMDDQLEISKELELQITGAEKPSLWRLLGIRFILLPYTIGKLATWQGWWIWRYWIKKKSYTWEDAAFLTCSYLAISNSVWNSMSMGSLTPFGSSKQKSAASGKLDMQKPDHESWEAARCYSLSMFLFILQSIV